MSSWTNDLGNGAVARVGLYIGRVARIGLYVGTWSGSRGLLWQVLGDRNHELHWGAST